MFARDRIVVMVFGLFIVAGESAIADSVTISADWTMFAYINALNAPNTLYSAPLSQAPQISGPY